MLYFSESADLVLGVDGVHILEHIGLHGCAWACLVFWRGFSVSETWIRGYEEHTTGCWWASCRSFPRRLAGEPLCREQTGTSTPMLYSCLLLSQLVRTGVGTTSGVVRDSLVDALAELYLA